MFKDCGSVERVMGFEGEGIGLNYLRGKMSFMCEEAGGSHSRFNYLKNIELNWGKVFGSKRI